MCQYASNLIFNLCSNRPEAFDITNHVEKEGTHYYSAGEFSDVWKGELSLPDGSSRVVAIKVIRGAPSHDTEVVDRVNSKFRDEVQTWMKLHHRNVCQCFGLAFRFSYLPAIIMPFSPEGNILVFLRKYPNSRRSSLILQTLRGLKYLHSMNIVHGDIRAANILIWNDSRWGPRACLVDYGLSSIVTPGDFTSQKVAGPCRWAPPELLQSGEEECDFASEIPYFTMAGDIYAFAMTVVEILSGKPPFARRRYDGSVIMAVIAGERPTKEDVPQEYRIVGLWNILGKCWDSNPKNRPNADDLDYQLSICLIDIFSIAGLIDTAHLAYMQLFHLLNFFSLVFRLSKTP